MKMTTTKTAGQLRDEVRAIVKQYYDVALAPQAFVPGQSGVPVSGKVFEGLTKIHRHLCQSGSILGSGGLSIKGFLTAFLHSKGS